MEASSPPSPVAQAPSPAAPASAAASAAASSAGSAAAASRQPVSAVDVSPVSKIAGAAKGSTKHSQRDLHQKVYLIMCEPHPDGMVHLPRFKGTLNVGFLRRAEMYYLPSKDFDPTALPSVADFCQTPMYKWHAVGGIMSQSTFGLELAMTRWKDTLRIANNEEEADLIKLYAKDKQTTCIAGQAVWLKGVRVRAEFDVDLMRATLCMPKATGPHKGRAAPAESLLRVFPTRNEFNLVYERLAAAKVFEEPAGRVSGGAVVGVPRTMTASGLPPGPEPKQCRTNPVLGPLVAHTSENWSQVTLQANCPTPWIEEVHREGRLELTIAMLYPDPASFTYYYGRSPTRLVLKYAYPSQVAQRLNYSTGRAAAVWLHEATVPSGGGRFWIERSVMDFSEGYVKLHFPYATEAVAPTPTIAQLPIPRGIVIPGGGPAAAFDEDDLPSGQIVL
eukprot:TRINITY_DN42940_c0_g1_i1.p2 TRINITY_DN42940_c0_g1~~TRINITY_DN42940_c0_g1_i1.p2  ORF type:complete len:447 (+),score=135.66 TRINITY_DN42940_c0_g1_i1:70-1410(+)